MQTTWLPRSIRDFAASRRTKHTQVHRSMQPHENGNRPYPLKFSKASTYRFTTCSTVDKAGSVKVAVAPARRLHCVFGCCSSGWRWRITMQRSIIGISSVHTNWFSVLCSCHYLHYRWMEELWNGSLPSQSHIISLGYTETRWVLDAIFEFISWNNASQLGKYKCSALVTDYDIDSQLIPIFCGTVVALVVIVRTTYKHRFWPRSHKAFDCFVRRQWPPLSAGQMQR